jgi:pyruvate/2-oxoglutarate dehydrogenase complex dihydrolipoamide dehydrogenase (E3) component
MAESRFDTNLLVIGGGAAGLVSSYIAATVRARVILVEKASMGGDCLNTGCVPSKALIRVARQAHDIQQAHKLGLNVQMGPVDFPAVMQRVKDVIKAIEPHDSIERYTGLGVEVIQGHAQLVSAHEVDVNGRRIRARSIILATGGQPFVPTIPGLNDVPWATSDSLWQWTTLPERLLVVGGGPIGCELAQAFARLGSRVTQIDMAPGIMVREDADATALVRTALEADGIHLMTGTALKRFENRNGQPLAHIEKAGTSREIPFDQCLLAIGRGPRTAGMGLDDAGVDTDERGFIRVNDCLQTSVPNIYACGDAISPYQFTHTASHEAWYCTVNALFGDLKKFRVDYSVIPWATFTDPEVARVGLNEAEAAEKGVAVEVTRYDIDDLDRAIADGQAQGFVKVLTVPGKDRILGATIVGAHAGEMITEFVTAMKQGLGLNKILGTIHVYPTFSEANKYAAGEWKRRHAPETILKWLGRYHRFRR